MRRVIVIVVWVLAVVVRSGGPLGAVSMDGDAGGEGGEGKVGATVTVQGGQPGAGSGAGEVPPPSRGSGGGGSGPPLPQFVQLVLNTTDGPLPSLYCGMGRLPDWMCEPVAPAGPATPPVDPGAVARQIREEVPVEVPAPHTSPPADGFQLTGLRTWFWLDRERWVPASVRADVAGVWIEVTATPTSATWDPGDGGAAVTCAGPARPYAGEGSTTTCGHTYTETGHLEVGLSVSYAVTWRASTGASGTLDPLVLTASLPLEVEQRQAVID